MIYFDNAATSWPKPFSVISSSRTGLSSLGANPGRGGYEMSLDTAQAIYETRKLASSFFGLDRPEQVIFTQNCTHAINYALKGILKRGDHVVVSNMEHNAVMRPLQSMADKGIISYDAAAVKDTNDETVESFSRLIKRNTKMLVCLHASNVDGRIMPIEKLGSLAKKHNILLLVDAAQSSGVIDINMVKQNIHLLAVAGHKGLYGPMGTGMLLINGDIHIDSIIEGGTGSVSSEFEQPNFLPDRLESGTPNVPGILGLDAGIRFVSEMGPRYILAHEQELALLAATGLAQMRGIKLYFQHKGVGVLSFSMEGVSCEKVSAALASKDIATRAGLHCAPAAHKTIGSPTSGLVRLSFGVFNDREQISEFLKIFTELDLKPVNL